MAKIESSLKNMILSLSLIGIIMTVLLAYVYTLTKEPIANSEKKKEIDAIKLVCPEFDNDPIASKQTIDGLDYFVLTKGTDTVGYAVKSFTDKGFSGVFTVMIGFYADGKLFDYSVLVHKETPGLGTKMLETKFKSQFKDLDLTDFNLKVKKDGGDVDAITAATITSRGFCDALQKAKDGIAKNFIAK